VREPPVVNASPLILLSRAARFDLLRVAGDEVLVPRAVATEIGAYGETDPTAIALRGSEWITTVDVAVMPLEVARWDLGPGESEVLAWALAHPGTFAIVDDLGARRCASTLGIPIHGTVGLVLLAKQRRVLAAARPVINELRAAGMYLSDDLLDRALALVGE
jgi:predicted nucleic acid-binding protein